MNLIKEYLGSIAGVEIIAIIAMLLFIITFILMLLHTYSLNKDEIREYSQLPLDHDEADQYDD